MVFTLRGRYSYHTVKFLSAITWRITQSLPSVNLKQSVLKHEVDAIFIQPYFPEIRIVGRAVNLLGSSEGEAAFIACHAGADSAAYDEVPVLGRDVWIFLTRVTE